MRSCCGNRAFDEHRNGAGSPAGGDALASPIREPVGTRAPSQLVQVLPLLRQPRLRLEQTRLRSAPGAEAGGQRSAGSPRDPGIGAAAARGSSRAQPWLRRRFCCRAAAGLGFCLSLPASGTRLPPLRVSIFCAFCFPPKVAACSVIRFSLFFAKSAKNRINNRKRGRACSLRGGWGGTRQPIAIRTGNTGPRGPRARLLHGAAFAQRVPAREP